MKTSDFYYDLPEELIAQDPLEDRSGSRLLFLDKETGKNRASYLSGCDRLSESGRLSGHQRYKSNSGTPDRRKRRHRCQDRGPPVEARRKRCVGNTGKTGEKSKTGNQDQFRRRTSGRRGCGCGRRGKPSDSL